MSVRRTNRLPGKAFLRRGHPLRQREPAVGHASRLAALNGVGMADLLMDMRINVRDLGRGDAAAVTALADLRSLSTEDRDALSKYTPWRTVGDQIATVAGNRLLPRSVLSTSVRICPHCVAEDMTGFEGPRNARPWLRLEWLCGHIRVCGRHGNLLVEVASSHPTHRTFDFSRTLADQVLPRLDRYRSECVPGPGGAFGDWIVSRLDGVVDPSNWLDDVPLHAGIAFCELLGVSSRHGLETTPTSFPMSEWATAAEEGYLTASRGEAAIDAVLDRMVEQRPSKRGFLGHEKAYGHLYLYLRRYGGDAGYEKVRDVVREHAFATIPFSPGRSVLGVKLEARRVHNQATAARTCARSGVGMRRLLAGSGIDLTGDVDPLKARIKIPVGDFEAVVAAMGGYATTKDVADATGFDIRLVDRLADEGILKSLPADARPAGAYHRFRREDVDDLMSSLFRDAIAVDATSERRTSVAKARNTTRGYAGDILSLILDGSLAWVGRLGDGGRYEHLLVDIDEVVAIMRARSVRKGMYVKEAEALIPGVYKSNISRLAKAGLLSATTEFCEKSMRTMDVLTRESVEAFAAEYVSVAELGVDTGVHVKVVARRLLEVGVVEAIDRDIPKTRIYRRRDVAASGAFEGWPASRR